MHGNFEGQAITKPTPDGGLIQTGYGTITGQDGETHAGFYVKIDDSAGTTVAEFALTHGTMEAFVLAIGETVVAEMATQLEGK